MAAMDKLKEIQDRMGYGSARLCYADGKWWVFVGYEIDETSIIETDSFDTAEKALSQADGMVSRYLGDCSSYDEKIEKDRARTSAAWPSYCAYADGGGQLDFWAWFWQIGPGDEQEASSLAAIKQQATDLA